LVEQNADFLQKRYSTKNVQVINLVDDLDETVFFESFPTEHYTSVGRKHIAQKMIEEINSKK
jgi:predicted class III extradiol MEMO1 family dioxygenase